MTTHMWKVNLKKKVIKCAVFLNVSRAHDTIRKRGELLLKLTEILKCEKFLDF